MNKTNSIDYITPGISKNNGQLIKEFILEGKRYSYKLIVSTNNGYLFFKIEVLNGIVLFFYQNKYEYKAIINILKLNDKLYNNYEKIIELINEAYLNKKIILKDNNENSVELIIIIPIGYKEYDCSFILNKKELEIKNKIDLLINEVHNLYKNNNLKKLEEILLNIKICTEKKLDENRKIINSLSIELENNQTKLKQNKDKILILENEIINIKNGILEIIIKENKDKIIYKKKFNSLYINKLINEDNNINNIDNKDKIINDLKQEIDNIKIQYNKYYKDRIKNLVSYYEEIINPYEGNKNINIIEYENFKNTILNNDNKIVEQNKFNLINEKLIQNKIQEKQKLNESIKDIYNEFEIINDDIISKERANTVQLERNKNKFDDDSILNIQFINEYCKICKNANLKNIYKCALCNNYFLCLNCYKNNNKKKFHCHNIFFDIIFPIEIIKHKQEKQNKEEKLKRAITNFQEFLDNIFFDKKGNLSMSQLSEPIFKNLKIHCKEMILNNDYPMDFFAEYQTTFINAKKEKLDKEKKIIFQKKLELFVIKLDEAINR